MVTEVIAVSCGVTQCQETLRTAMAIGADRAILVETTEELQPWPWPSCSRPWWTRNSPNSSFLGKQAIDDDANQTGQMLAALADLPQATFASRSRSAATRPVSPVRSMAAWKPCNCHLPPWSRPICA